MKLADGSLVACPTSFDVGEALTAAPAMLSVGPRRAVRLVEEEGYSLVDCRIAWSHGEWNQPRALHSPLVREIKGNSPIQVARIVGSGAFGARRNKS